MVFNFLSGSEEGLEKEMDSINSSQAEVIREPEFEETAETAEAARLSDGQARQKSAFYQKIIRFLVLIGVFAVPLFMLPGSTSILELNKQLILVGLAGAGLILWLISVVSSGRLEWRVNSIDKGVAAVLLAVILATAFSTEKFKSLFGMSGSLANALITIAALSIFYFLAVNVFEDKGQRLKALFGLSVAIVFLYSLLQMFGAYAVRLPFAMSRAFNSVGSLNALGILAAVSLPFFTKTKISLFRRVDISKIGLILGLAILVILNWWVLWTVAIVGMAALIVFENMKGARFRMSRFLLPMTVIVLAVFLLLVNFNLTSLKNKFPLEVAPSYGLSGHVAASALKENLIFGYGPENFSIAFDKFGAGRLANTTLSSAKFFDATSEFLSTATQTGIVGAAALVFLLWTVIWAITKRRAALKDDETGETTGLLAMLAALSAALFFYPFNLTIMFAFYVALALAALALWNNRQEYNVEEKTWLSLVASLGFIAGLILVLVGGYFTAANYAADLKFSKALAADTNQNAANALVDAINWNGNDDQYYLAASQAALGLLNEELGKKADPKDSERQTRIQNYLSSAITLAQRATQVGPRESNNWINLGNVYQSLLGLVDGVDKMADDSYTKAASLRPGDAGIYNRLGSLYLTKSGVWLQLASAGGDSEKFKREAGEALTKAEENFKKAIEISDNYGIAIYNLGVVYDRQGKLANAIQQLERIMPFNSNQPALAFELGLLYYRANQKDKALGQLQRAVVLSPDYSNARWYLALIYEERGDFPAAIDQINRILSLDINKDNQAVLAKLDQLKKGQTSIPPAKVLDQKPIQ